MKNKLIDLNNHLFCQMERLSDESTKGKKLAEEITRASAVASIAKQIIGGAQLALKAQIAVNDRLIPRLPAMLGDGKNGDGSET